MSVAADTGSKPPEIWHAACKLKSILVGTGVAALVDDRPVAVFRPDPNSVYALGNIDPFSGASVLCRGLLGDVDGELVVASPVFKQHFRLIDGRCVEDETVSVAAYPVTVADGEVFIRVPG